MCLTSDGGVVISLTQLDYKTVIAKFSASGTLAFYKIYTHAGNSISGGGPICQSRDGTRYLMVLPNDYDTAPFHDPTVYDGATLLVFDLSGNLIGQRRFQPNLNSGEIPAAVIATADGGFATLGRLNNAGPIAKLSSDLSTVVFRDLITVDGNVAPADATDHAKSV